MIACGRGRGRQMCARIPTQAVGRTMASANAQPLSLSGPLSQDWTKQPDRARLWLFDGCDVCGVELVDRLQSPRMRPANRVKIPMKPE